MVTSSLLPIPDVRFSANELPTQTFNYTDAGWPEFTVAFSNQTLPIGGGTNGWDTGTSIYTVPLATEESGVDIIFSFLVKLFNLAGNLAGLTGVVYFDLMRSTNGS